MKTTNSGLSIDGGNANEEPKSAYSPSPFNMGAGAIAAVGLYWYLTKTNHTGLMPIAISLAAGIGAYVVVCHLNKPKENIKPSSTE